MPVVVGVRYKERGRMYYFDPSGLELTCGDRVLVETVRGLELGEIVLEPTDVPEEKVVSPLKKVIRVATPDDISVGQANKEKASNAMEIARAKIADHGLEMHLVDAEYAFDGSPFLS